MALPKNHTVKPSIPLTYPKILHQRREELAEMISKDGTYLPKSLLHADLDRGFLDFVRDKLGITTEGKVVPVVDILITTQNWEQFVKTWDYQNIDKNVEPPFITTIRVPEVKYGNNPAVIYNIPNRKMYYYMEVPTWDGNRHGADIYKIPQPIPVDIKYSVVIVCNRMREINSFNKKVIETFASKQAYQNIKGHYIPIINDSMTDESALDLEKRKYYIQKYEFTMMGFLLDEDEFEVYPALSRTFQMFEVDQTPVKRPTKKSIPIIPPKLTLSYIVGVTSEEHFYEYTCNVTAFETNNITSYQVYINDDFYGTDVSTIQINTGDVLRIDVTPIDPNKPSSILFSESLI
jgi:hypothetical protein